MRAITLCWIGILVAAVSGGCAKYEYDLVRPEQYARHIGAKADEIIDIEPLEYHLRTVENRLLMMVYNHTETPVYLIGGKSYIVTPSGESKALRNVTIAPGSFIKLVMPPLRPRVYRSGPTFGVGVGVGSGGHSGVGVGVGHDIGDDYYYAGDDDAEFYWEWEGESDVRLNMVYRQDEREFAHEFVFHRKKM